MTFTNTLTDPRVGTTLSRMFAAAADDDFAAAGIADRPGGFAAMSPQEQADAAARIYMPISAAGGQLLYSLVRAVRPATVVEFGTSFGISTLHLAAAVRDNGTGRVVSTELNADKAAAARRAFAETGLDDVVTVLEGDARETLADLDAGADFVLLDGWKDLCLPVLRLLEPRLAPGTLVVADDVELDGLRPYLDYVRDPANGYQSVTFPVEDGMEISCRL
ncbi:class I SAM-dependent methyltransferase [Streptomyces sp. SL13]|jgi:predicted O-methyltransferase YrrM|uniref:Class I SAM-dependent methyltransferase n=1 Tax=Streptantibioticus silvisoli TaxID=2705255 RepID=A0AA90HF82_9ACTN|nr:class I SAM-dependent methyltransferase [Streptantibioticus silvisoli]MDI5966851.1 class I SAM-dependent methyltransferase [Streptantibioticus silvisoli]MDI5973867.1 class I SAM-dependent methyltransferase [Streptantibioticus silvisoli]